VKHTQANDTKLLFYQAKLTQQ